MTGAPLTPLGQMQARIAQAGQVEWIGVRPARRAAMQAVEQAVVGFDGLEGDRARAGKRAVTLVQAEHFAAIGSFLGRGPVAPEMLRRNLVVSGINLLSLRDREICVGSARVRITGICAPCSRMEEAFGEGGYAAVRGHGGVTAEVIEVGRIALGDPVAPAP